MVYADFSSKMRLSLTYMDVICIVFNTQLDSSKISKIKSALRDIPYVLDICTFKGFIFVCACVCFFNALKRVDNSEVGSEVTSNLLEYFFSNTWNL